VDCREDKEKWLLMTCRLTKVQTLREPAYTSRNAFEVGLEVKRKLGKESLPGSFFA
jgi:hypothetical protein